MRMPSLEDIRAERARRMSLAQFVRDSWPVLEQRCGLIWGWHMDAICDHVQALLDGWDEASKTGRPPRAQNVVVNVPPGCSKSRIVSVCAPAWRWLRRPDCRFAAIAGNPRVAVRDSLFTRQIIRSDWYQYTFRPTWWMSADQDTKTLFSNSAGGQRSACAVGSKIIGERSDVQLFDDLLDVRDAYSKAKRTAVNEWYDAAAANRVSNGLTSVRIGIMQRLHVEDWSGHVLASGQWEHLCIPMRFDPAVKQKPTWIGWTDPRTQPDELMCAERFGPEWMAQERARLGSAQDSAQNQQQPSPVEGNMLKRSWWKRYTIVPRLDFTVAFWDLSNSEAPSDNSSYVVGLLLGVAGPDRYVLDVDRARRTPHGSELAIAAAQRRWTERWGAPLVTLIENKAAGPAVTERIRRVFPRIQASNPVGSKEERVAGIVPALEAGNGYVPEQAPWIDDFLEECAAFPRGAHDDQCDSLTGAWLWADKHQGQRRSVMAPSVGMVAGGYPLDS